MSEDEEVVEWDGVLKCKNKSKLLTANVVYGYVGDPASYVESGKEKKGDGGLEVKVRGKKKCWRGNEAIDGLNKIKCFFF